MWWYVRAALALPLMVLAAILLWTGDQLAQVGNAIVSDGGRQG